MSIFDGARARTLAVHSPAIPQFLGRSALEPVRLSGREGLNSLFEYELLLKTPDALNLGASGAMDFDLDSFIGREITCSIQLDGMSQLLIVEGLMKQGVPAAFDKMGTYHQSGIGVKPDIDRAYGFWQLAADMGKPSGEEDSPRPNE